MAIENCTCTTKEPDALWAVLEIHECVTQAAAITRLMGAAPPDDDMPTDTRQNAAWAVCALLNRIDHAAGKLGRLASAREG